MGLAGLAVGVEGDVEGDDIGEDAVLEEGAVEGDG